MVKKIVVVIGANYGDEGKGLASRYFALNNDDSQIVLFNGGPQRGHTVEKPDGFRHVFKHFGAGACDDIPTQYDSNFMVNPMIFAKEWYELKTYGFKVSSSYLSNSCRVITPFDMILNQLIEKSRGDKKHGSCGHGIWETMVRYNNDDCAYSASAGELAGMKDKDLFDYLSGLRDEYMKPRMKELDIWPLYKLYPFYASVIDKPGLITNYIRDFRFMTNVCLANISFFTDASTLIYEGGQGLMLDKDNVDEWPNVTASSTGAAYLLNDLKYYDPDELEICYVTRPYVTRHGKGSLNNECGKTEVVKYSFEDKTNVWNEWQDHIRYARLSWIELEKRIHKDFDAVKAELPQAKISIMVTQMNSVHDKLQRVAKRALENFGDWKAYIAPSPYAEDVEMVKKGEQQ